MAVIANPRITALALAAQIGDHLEQNLANVGTNTIADVYLSRREGHGEGLDRTVPAHGSTGHVAREIPWTGGGGAAGEAGPMLQGASGFDSSGRAIDVATMGRDIAALQPVFPAIGVDMLHSAIRPTTPLATRDLRIPLILYRIDNFCFRAPSPVSLRMGNASEAESVAGLLN